MKNEDMAGRIMAHAFHDELEKVEKTASAERFLRLLHSSTPIEKRRPALRRAMEKYLRRVEGQGSKLSKRMKRRRYAKKIGASPRADLMTLAERAVEAGPTDAMRFPVEGLVRPK